MESQQGIMFNAIRDIEDRFTKDEHVTASYQCGADLSVVASGGMTPIEHCVITMFTYDMPIARVDLCDLDDDGNNSPKVEVHCRYHDYSVKTVRHLRFFLNALIKAGVIGSDVLDRRFSFEGGKDLVRRALKAYPLCGPRFDGFIAL